MLKDPDVEGLPTARLERRVTSKRLKFFTLYKTVTPVKIGVRSFVVWLKALDIFSFQGFYNVVLTSWHQEICTTLVLNIWYAILLKALIPLQGAK